MPVNREATKSKPPLFFCFNFIYFFIFWFERKRLRERESEWIMELLFQLFVHSFIGWFLCMPWPGTKHATLDDALTKGGRTHLFSEIWYHLMNFYEVGNILFLLKESKPHIQRDTKKKGNLRPSRENARTPIAYPSQDNLLLCLRRGSKLIICLKDSNNLAWYKNKLLPN